MDLAKGKDWPDAESAEERKQLARREEASEELRLLYVALTRAQHHTAIWWANSGGTATRALSRLLFSPRSDGALDPSEFETGRCTVPAEDDVPAALDALAAESGGTVTVSVISDPQTPATPWVDTVAEPDTTELGISRLAVDLDRSVRRWSFSAITAGVDAGPDHGLDPYDPTGADRGADDEDEPVGPEVDVDVEDDGDGAAGGPLARLRAGTRFGTFVHAVLERVDFAADDLDGTIADGRRRRARGQRHRPVGAGPGGNRRDRTAHFRAPRRHRDAARTALRIVPPR